ncbi:MAG: TonB-dependent receptor [Cyanobacteria bacterium]|nr:TonB-dependent receptor [Cyanobacteriota bacterium]
MLVSVPAFGQGGVTSTISGVVSDNSGAVVPGAAVVALHRATGVSQESITNSDGTFAFPSMNPGTYTVTISLTGFRTVVINDVVLTSGAPANLRATLEVGGLTEQVTVTSTSEIVQTISSTVSSTINTNQITKLPLTSRSAMDFVNFLPGVSTPAGNRDATINGLPRGMINITLDGVNIQDNTLRSTDGFFAIVSPRLDSVEEVTVTTASQGAGDAGSGAVQVKFVTRSGTNQLTGSGYYYYRSDKLNANTWFNNRNGVDKAKLKQNQPGFRIGGPIVIPGLFDGRNKAFFFVNYEEFRQPSDTTRNRTLLNPAAVAGNFSYTAGGVTQTVNVLQLAAAGGQLSTVDPTIGKLLGDILAATRGGSLSVIDPNLDRFSFNVPVKTMRRFPTFKLDYQLNQAHRASFAYNYQKFTDYPDTLNNFDASFPGFPVAAGQQSIRLGWSAPVRSVLRQNLVNEARVGYSGAPVRFFDELNVGMFTGTLAPQAGYAVIFPTINSTLTNPGPTPSPQSRNANSLVFGDTLTWLKGAHSFNLGGAFTRYDTWAVNSMLVPQLRFGVLSSDPASPLFNAANFPGASATNITAASNLYALLTGRINQIAGDARINEQTGEYEWVGAGRQSGRLQEAGIFLQDSWRLRPNLSLNAGVRYDVQLPFTPLNSLYSYATVDDLCGVSGANNGNRCNLFQPGVMPGTKPTFKQLTAGTATYATDRNNIAPSLGFAWTPARRGGMLGTLMGRDGDFVLRGGYTRSYSRPGLSDFTGIYNANPGIRIVLNRDEATGNLGPTPLLLRNTSQLTPPAFASKPVYPMTDVITQDVSVLDPRLKVPSADSWSVGVQRSVGANMALEVRYVGTRGRDSWRTTTDGNNGNNNAGSLNFNEFNIFENGFVNEFRLAQANLQSNIAAGRGATFAYTGAAGTSPLPTFAAFFNGVSAANAGNAALYTGTSWSNQAFLNFLAARNPNPFGFASAGTNGLMGNATFRANAAAAGVPANFFVANPDLLGGAFMTTNIGRTTYDSMQVELRRRYAGGLQFQTSYVLGKGYLSAWETWRRDSVMLRDAGTPGDVTHQFKANVVYDLPFGRSRKFGANVNGFVDRMIGGWQIGLSARIQSGRLIDLGNVRMVGMTRSELQSMFKLRFDDAGRKVWMMPQDVIDNTIAAFSVSATSPTGYAGTPPSGRYLAPANGPDCIEVDSGADYGECANRSIVLTGPLFRQFDLRFSKRTRLAGTTNLELAAEMLNALNQPNFVPVGIGSGATLGNTITSYEVTTLTRHEHVACHPAGHTDQLVGPVVRFVRGQGFLTP